MWCSRVTVPLFLAAHEEQDHSRRLHAGIDLEQAGRREQGCKDDGAERGHK